MPKELPLGPGELNLHQTKSRQAAPTDSPVCQGINTQCRISGKTLEAVKHIPKCTWHPECPRLGAGSHTSPSSQGKVTECNAEDCVGHWSLRHLRALTLPFHELDSKAPPSWQCYLLQISSPKLPMYFSADLLLLFPVPISDFLCCPRNINPQGPAPL